MKFEAGFIVLGSALYTVAFALFEIGGEELWSGEMLAVSSAVVLVGVAVVASIFLVVIRALRRDLRQLGGESA